MPTSIVPVMTGNAAPSGIVTSSSVLNNSDYGGFSGDHSPFLAFTRNPASDGWISADNGANDWIQYQFPTAQTVTSYDIKDGGSYAPVFGWQPKSWTLQGSNDGSTWTTLDTQTGQGRNAGPFTVGSPGSYLYYRLHVTENQGGSYPGGAINVRDLELYGPVAPSAPSAPTEYAATTTSITLALPALPSGATAMELQRAAHGDSLVDLADVTAYAGGNYTDSAGLSALTEYDYALVASNAVGNSPPSSILNAWTIPTAPSGLSGTAGYAQVALSWDAESGATGYNVKRRLHGSGSYATVSGGGNVSGTSFTDTTPTAGVSYDYLVTALDAGGESSGSNVVTVTPTAPSAPTVTAVNQTHIDVAVPALAGGASSYDVQRAPDSGGSPGSWSTVQASATPSATFHDSSLSASTTYWYRLISTNSGGGTASGASRSATTLPTDTTAPAYASAQTSADGTYIDVAFTETGSPPLLPATGVTGFTVKVNGATRAIASAVRHSSLVIRLTLAEPVANFDAVKVSYNGGTGNVTDSAS